VYDHKIFKYNIYNSFSITKGTMYSLTEINKWNHFGRKSWERNTETTQPEDDNQCPYELETRIGGETIRAPAAIHHMTRVVV